jgi:hypothetical protein
MLYLTFGIRVTPKEESSGADAKDPPELDPPDEPPEMSRDTEDGIFFGVRLPRFVAEANFLIAGTIGSGKTILQRLLFQSFLPHIRPGSNRRAIIFDAKREFHSVISKMAPHCPIVVMDPFDARSSPWRMCSDIRTPAAARQVATAFFPDEKYSQPFWTLAARGIVKNLFVALNLKAPDNWDLRDAVLLTRDQGFLEQFIKSVPETRHAFDNYRDEKVRNDILSTIESRMEGFETIAALGHNSKNEPVSLRDFPRQDVILRFADDPSMHEDLQPVNQLAFKNLQDALLSRWDGDPGETFVGIDELARLGEVEDFQDFYLTGRSFGVHCSASFQEIDSVRRLHGKEGANEIIGQCGNKAFLRQEGDESARWASDMLGKVGLYEYDPSWDPEGRMSETRRYVERDAMLPSEFMTFPPTGPATGLTGVFICPWVGAFKGTIPWSTIMDMLVQPDPSVPNFIPRPASDQYLKPFTAEDLKRLGIQPSNGPRLKFTGNP